MWALWHNDDEPGFIGIHSDDDAFGRKRFTREPKLDDDECEKHDGRYR